MTTTDPTPTTGPTHADDPRPHLRGALGACLDIVSAIPPAQRGLPTPCAAWDVETLSRHTLAIARRVVALGRGEHWSSVPEVATDEAADDLAPALADSIDEVELAWADDASLGETVELPFGVLPGAIALTVYAAEFSIHGWDLAHATGRPLRLDPATAELALAAVTEGIPAEPRGDAMPFDPVRPVDPGASAIERAVAWVGRQP